MFTVVSERCTSGNGAAQHHQHHGAVQPPGGKEQVTRQSLVLNPSHPYVKLVAIRSPHNLFMLEKALQETDPDTTVVVVMTAKVTPPGPGATIMPADLDTYDPTSLMTAVVDQAERARQGGPSARRFPTNNPLYVVLKTARPTWGEREVVLGASNLYTAEEQLDQISLYWINLNEGQQAPLSIHILSHNRDVYLDLGGGSRIPKSGRTAGAQCCGAARRRRRRRSRADAPRRRSGQPAICSRKC